MTPFSKRNLITAVAAILLAGLLFGIIKTVPALRNHVQHLELIVISLLIMTSLVIMLFWTTLGVFGGLSSFLLAMIFLYKPLTALNPYYYAVFIFAFFANSFTGYWISRKISGSSQDYTVAMEKINEDTNLIRNHAANRNAEISAMGEKINGLLKLKSIADVLSLSLSEEEVTKMTTERTFDVFGDDTRVLLYTVDEDISELSLVRTAKGASRKTVVMKKGGIFDRWAMKNMKSLLVKDVGKDFRFSIEGAEMADDFKSLMIKPLITESKVLGILRVDSERDSAFSQHELRILDIIGELTAVALQNARLYRRTEELAIRDSLTGLFVHRYFMERLEEEVKRGLRSNNAFALLMVDIDEFKKFNDEHGHIAGDVVLRNIGRILSSKTAPGDIAARYGGEEFALIALNCGKEQADRLAETIREEISSSFVTLRREKYSVTVSIGVAMFPTDAKLREDIVWAADRCLYKAKAGGKNRVCTM
jgi:diguanylate cyclase (GGDEF)-like protein